MAKRRNQKRKKYRVVFSGGQEVMVKARSHRQAKNRAIVQTGRNLYEIEGCFIAGPATPNLRSLEFQPFRERQAAIARQARRGLGISW